MLKIYHIEGPLDCPNWPKKVDESCLIALQSEVSQLDFHVVFEPLSDAGGRWNNAGKGHNRPLRIPFGHL